MNQKIIKIGSSIGVVIPKPIAQEKGYVAGGTVTLLPVNDSNAIRIEPTVSETKKVGNSELIAWAEDAVNRYRPALEALKDK